MLTPSEIAKEVESGTRSALSAAVLLKRMSEDLEAAYTAVRKRAYEEQVKYATRMMMERNETVVDEETGEIIPVAESRTGEDSISIKL